MSDDGTPEAPVDAAADNASTPADAGNLPQVESPSIVPDKQPGQWSPEALEKQIAKQHRKIKEYEERVLYAQQVEAENKRLRDYVEALARQQQGGQAPQQVPPSASPQLQQPQPQYAPDADAIREDVKFELQSEQLNQRLNAEYGEQWTIAYANYQKAGNFTKEFLRDAMGTSDPAYVLVELGKDPVRLIDVLNSPPEQRRMVLAEMAAEKKFKQQAAGDEPKLPGLPRPSNAPPPPTGDRQRGGPVQTGGSNLYDPRYDFRNYYNNDFHVEKANDDAWYAERMRQKRESVGRAWSFKDRPSH